MAKIKCEYYKEAYCQKQRSGETTEYFDMLSCVEGIYTNDYCYKPRTPDVIGSACIHARRPKAEFEKECKSYELDEDILKIGRKEIYVEDIIFLEIDGKVKIDEL